MHAAQYGDRDDATDGLNRAADGCVFAQREMRANAIIIGGVSGQDSAQMCLAEYDDMVEAFPSDRADHPFNAAILPRRARRDGSISDPHRPKSLRDDGAIGAILIADEVSRRLVPLKRLSDLSGDPLRRRIRGDIGPNQVSPIEAKDHEAV